MKYEYCWLSLLEAAVSAMHQKKVIGMFTLSTFTNLSGISTLVRQKML